MFGLESNLNWYSWYIYFYIFAMLIMIPLSRFINRFGWKGVIGLVIVSFGAIGAIHQIPFWSKNIWWQAVHDCFLCSPVMFAGYWLAANNIVSRIKIPHNFPAGLLCLAIGCLMFFIRRVPGVQFFDFVSVTVFIGSIVSFFNIVREQYIVRTLTALGKQSMNMWFLHALFATACTAMVFAPLITWIEPRWLMILVLVVFSYLGSKIINAVYNKLAGTRISRD